MQRAYTHLGQVRVYECMALTQLGPSLADLCWDARVLRRVLDFLLHQLRVFQRYSLAMWSAGKHCEADSEPYHLLGCGRQGLFFSEVPHTCINAMTRIFGRVCVPVRRDDVQVCTSHMQVRI